MSNSYVLLEKVVVPAAGASSVTFANIPQTGYTDLVVVSSARSATGSGNWDGVYVSFNGTSVTTNHSARRLYGFSSTAASDSSLPYAGIIPSNGTTANTFGSASMYIPNYAGNTNKSISVDASTENNSVNAINFLTAGLWSNTAAITSITLTAESTSNFMANSTFYLYGIAKFGTTPTIAPKATGGDVIDTDGTYWYHIFRSSGTFRPATALTCDYLVVAGGGGGGAWDGGGGGGAGGLRSTVTATGGGGSLETAISLASATNYTVTIGAGGAGGSGSYGTRGTSGSNSVFGSITSTGGGGGGSGSNAGLTGGSGGGGPQGGVTPGSGTTAQGYAGGNGGSGGSSVTAGGGGGGSGSVGANFSTRNGGNGGSGVATSITGSSVTYAGGGGAGAGDGSGATGGTGAAGGGNGGGFYGNPGTAATVNTGSGGGGGAYGGGVGAAGGSGIVVVRYLVA
jgi:hypothetical protein